MAFKLDSVPIIESMTEAVAKSVEAQLLADLDAHLKEARAKAVIEIRRYIHGFVLRQMPSQYTDRIELLIVLPQEKDPAKSGKAAERTE